MAKNKMGRNPFQRSAGQTERGRSQERAKTSASVVSVLRDPTADPIQLIKDDREIEFKNEILYKIESKLKGSEDAVRNMAQKAQSTVECILVDLPAHVITRAIRAYVRLVN